MVIYLIYGCAFLAMIVAWVFAQKVRAIPLEADNAQQLDRMKEISSAVANGATTFLAREFRYVAIFAILFSLFMVLTLDNATTPFNEGMFSAAAFLAGAIASCASSVLGMKIATIGNIRTTLRARKGLVDAFKVAFNSGAVMGFGLVGLALFGLISMYVLYEYLLAGQDGSSAHVIMEMIAGFGLGGSTVALFSRVGGGIFTKAADVGAGR